MAVAKHEVGVGGKAGEGCERNFHNIFCAIVVDLNIQIFVMTDDFVTILK